MKPSRIFSLLTVICVACSSCGTDESPDSAVSQTSPVTAASRPSGTKAKSVADDTTAKMARAVGNGKPGAAVDIRYEFHGKPSAGIPTELEIAFIPSAGVDSLDATISGMDGVTVAGQLTVSFTNVEAGKSYKHTVSVLPDHTGVYYITVVANTQISGSSLGRTFSVPFVVGNMPAQQKAAPQKEASGQAIQPMKAQETTR